VLSHARKELRGTLLLLFYTTQQTHHNKHIITNMSNYYSSTAASSSTSFAAAIDKSSSSDEEEVSDSLIDHSGDEDKESTTDNNYNDVDLESIFFVMPGSSRTGCPGHRDGSHGGPPLPRALRSKHWHCTPCLECHGGGQPPPQEVPSKAPALDALFLKVYPRKAAGCSAVGSGGGAIDPKTLQKWVWLMIERIAELADKVVSIFYISLSSQASFL
jgi:hypothetical protein